MRHDRWYHEVSLNIESKQLADLEGPVCDGRLFVKDVLVDNLAQNFLGVRLDLSLYAHDQVVELVEALLFEVVLK